MTLAELFIKISCDSKEAEKGIKETEKKTSKLGSIMGSVGKGAATVGKAVGATFAAAAVAVGKFALDATKAYANYEQLVGGVETLFGAGGRNLAEYQKDIGITSKSTQKQVKASQESYYNLLQAQDEVMRNAKNAYQTAGMDMNTYMDTVTSFSASLISSMKGDTLGAAKAADQAITDMSDNANKMGTDIQSIQNAYQGFAKQNYTMLDNLKLGYGGTRSEMQRLLKDAEKIQKANGKNVKYNIKNLNDVYEAIHVIQQEMGITGTTAKEAGTTIQGSLGMMKAAWMNLKIAIADPNGNVGEAVKNLIESAKTFAHNAAPVFGQALRGIGTAIKEMAPALAKELPTLFKDLLPNLIDAAGDLMGGLVDAIMQNAPMIIDGFGQIFQKVGSVLESSDNPIIQAFGKTISWLGDFIRDPQNALNKAWNWICESVFGVSPEVLVSWINDGWDAIKGAFETAIEWVGKVWNTTIEWIQNAWDTIVNAFNIAAEWVGQVFKATIEWICKAWDDVSNAFSVAGEWVGQVFNTTIEWVNNAWKAVSDAFDEAGKWIGKTFKTTVEWIQEKWQDLTDAVAEIKGWILEVPVNFVKGLIEDAKKAADEIRNWIVNVGVNFVPKTTNKKGEQVDVTESPGAAADFVHNVTTNPLGTGIKIFSNLFGGHAKGSWDVPYDMPTLVHRGETILTASQARRYREGEGNLDLSALANVIASSIQQGMRGATVNSYLDGKLVSNEVNKILGGNMVARRFA